MKPPDRLLHDLGVLGFLVKFWFALAIVAGLSLPSESLLASAASVVYALFVFVLLLVGAKLLVSLFRMPWKDSRGVGSPKRSV